MLDGVWGANNSWNFRNQQDFSSFNELMVWILDHQRNLALFAFTVWSIWHKRNQSWTQAAHQPLNLISQWAHDNWAKFKAQKMLRFNVLFYIVYWKYLWIFGSLTKSIGYLVI